MASNLLNILLLVALGLVGSQCHAALPSQLYWNSMLPNTPMPKFLRDMLQFEDMDVSARRGETKGAFARKGAGRYAGRQVSVTTGHKGRPPVYIGVAPGGIPFSYLYAVSDNQLHLDPNLSLFFLEKDLHSGTKMKLHFTADPNEATFLPNHVANSVPFSSNYLPQILHYFSIKPGSPEARVMKETIQECEKPSVQGEDKLCATSLESMIDFSTSKLGRNVEAICTEVEEEGEVQEYRIRDGVKKMGSNKFVVCHKMKYAYAVFYCHTTETTNAYMVPLEGVDGTKANAVAVCHIDTSAWNPKHLAFHVLNIKPGTFPICHFLPQNHILWLPK